MTTTQNAKELCFRLETLSALEAGWYANVGKRTGEQCCTAMTEAAALIRQQAERVERLEETLEPFAKLAKFDAHMPNPDGDAVDAWCLGLGLRFPRITYGHLRAARQALTDRGGDR